MDGAEAGAMPSSHVLIQTLDSINSRKLTELLVHVMSPRTRVITKPDPKVLDLHRLLFVDLAERSKDQSATPFRLPLEGCKGQLVRIHTTLTPMISPLAFLTFLSCLQWE